MNETAFDVSKITVGDLLALEAARKEGDLIALLAIMNRFCSFDVYQLSFVDLAPYIRQFADAVNTAVRECDPVWKMLNQSLKDHL